ncbi:MAG: hypothetical protein LBD20_03220 [Spirochaetaceae bacterium]|jgi:small-conductance mechanosensitive channel|nr:hypothetical protein [Spirochaetaceae bacterium]
MDERRKSILAIEEQKSAETAREAEHLRTLGRMLLERSDDGRLAVERNTYTKLNREIAAAQEQIEALAQKTFRAAELTEQINAEERQFAETEKALAAHYPELGRMLFEPKDADAGADTDQNGARFAEFTAPFCQRIAEIQQKTETLSARLSELETAEKGNVFSWLGKRAQGMVIKSSLSRTEAALKQVYAEAGAAAATGSELLNQPGMQLLPELDRICAETTKLKDECTSFHERLSKLKEEKRCITEALNHDGGGAVRKKANYEQQITRLLGELDQVYLRLGKKAEDPVARMALKSLFDDEMTQTLETALVSRDMVDEYNEQIAKLRVSLEVDDERTVIEKWERAVLEERRHIGDSEKKITEYTKLIADARDRIARLEQVKR